MFQRRRLCWASKLGRLMFEGNLVSYFALLNLQAYDVPNVLTAYF